MILNTLKIAWFSPFSKKSSIGKYSQIILEQLRHFCELHLFICNPETADILTTSVDAYFYRDDLAPVLAKYDLCIYNMGDYLPFHQKIYEISQQHPGIIILHDYVMHNFLAGYYLHTKKQPEFYVQTMKNIYGEKGEQITRDFLAGKLDTPLWEISQMINYPLFEPIITGAFGVIVHSNFLKEKVSNYSNVPVETIYFPAHYKSDLELSTADKADIKTELGIDKETLILLTFGHINPNKNILEILEVLGENKNIFSNYQYFFIGATENLSYYEDIKTLINNYQIAANIKFLGYQSDIVLQNYLEISDILINLRNPAMEGASGSLLQQLYAGKPIIVSNTGFYQEIPDDCILKTSITKEEQKEDLISALKLLFQNPEYRQKLGTNAQNFAKITFTTESYCQNFMTFVESILTIKPQLDLIDRVSQELKQMGITSDVEELTDKCAKEIEFFFIPPSI